MAKNLFACLIIASCMLQISVGIHSASDYSPAPAPDYSPAPAPDYSPAPDPDCSPAPAPDGSPAPAPAPVDCTGFFCPKCCEECKSKDDGYNMCFISCAKGTTNCDQPTPSPSPHVSRQRPDEGLIP